MKKKSVVIVIISIVLIAILMANKVFQNDTYYTIKVGESIIKNGIDFKDHFAIHSLSYSYPHWLYDVVVYGVYKLFDFKGLYIFNIVIYIVLGLVFFFVNKSINKRMTVVSIMSILTMVMINAYVVVRAQSISFILFLLEIYCLRKLLDSDDKKYSIYLIIISIIICNVHVAVWPLYYILFLPYIVEYLLAKFKEKKIVKILDKKLEIVKRKGIKKLFITLIVSLFTGLVSPLKDIPYTYFIRTFMGNSQSYIQEHKMSLGIGIITVSLIVVLGLIIIMIWRSKKKIRIVDIFMIVGLMIMAFMSKRHFSLFIILGMISVTGVIVRYLDKNNRIINDLVDSRVFLIIVILEVLMIGDIKFNYNIKNNYVDEKIYPVEGVKYLKDNYDVKKIRIFNEYNFGSYLLFKDIPVFIDSRADLYCKEFSGLSYDIFDDFMDINKGDIDKLNNYNIDIVFIYSGKVLDNTLKSNYDYREVYRDNYFVIYENIGIE